MISKTGKFLFISIKMLAKLALFMVQIFAVFACEKPTKTRYSSFKADELLELGTISEREHAKHIYPHH